MASPLVSVIIPAFNAEEFLMDCLLSVAAQDLRDFEAIVIDDGSSDSTSAIARRMADHDHRFSLFIVPNGGVSKARNIGIDHARGRYITFVDADDMLHPRALSQMHMHLEKTRSQVCVTAFKTFSATGETVWLFKTKPSGCPVELYDYEGAMKVALYQKRLLNSPWGVMMERSLLADSLRFREGSRYEDLDAFYRFYEKALRIVYLPMPYYFYRRNPSSFINNWSPARLDVLDVTDRLLVFMESRYPQLSEAAADRRFSAHCNMYLLMKRHRIKDREALRRCRRVIQEGRRQALRDPEVRLKNKIGALLSYLFIR